MIRIILKIPIRDTMTRVVIRVMKNFRETIRASLRVTIQATRAPQGLKSNGFSVQGHEV